MTLSRHRQFCMGQPDDTEPKPLPQSVTVVLDDIPFRVDIPEHTRIVEIDEEGSCPFGVMIGERPFIPNDEEHGDPFAMLQVEMFVQVHTKELISTSVRRVAAYINERFWINYNQFSSRCGKQISELVSASNSDVRDAQFNVRVAHTEQHLHQHSEHLKLIQKQQEHHEDRLLNAELKGAERDVKIASNAATLEYILNFLNLAPPSENDRGKKRSASEFEAKPAGMATPASELESKPSAKKSGAKTTPATVDTTYKKRSTAKKSGAKTTPAVVDTPNKKRSTAKKSGTKTTPAAVETPCKKRSTAKKSAKKTPKAASVEKKIDRTPPHGGLPIAGHGSICLKCKEAWDLKKSTCGIKSHNLIVPDSEDKE